MGKRKHSETKTKTEVTLEPEREKKSKKTPCEPERTATKSKKEPEKHRGKGTKTKTKKDCKKKSCSRKALERREPGVTEDDGEPEDDVQDEEHEDELSPEERRVLERKMKKLRNKEEKRRLKAEGKTVKKVEVQKASASQLALEYLTRWSEKHQEWKFQKTRQTWLLQHMFDPEKISDEHFLVLLSYLEGLRGSARDTTVQKAEALVRELERKGVDEANAQQGAQRAREVVQLLS